MLVILWFLVVIKYPIGYIILDLAIMSEVLLRYNLKQTNIIVIYLSVCGCSQKTSNLPRIYFIPVLKVDGTDFTNLSAAAIDRAIIDIPTKKVRTPLPSAIKVAWEIVVNKTSIIIDSIALSPVVKYLECH